MSSYTSPRASQVGSGRTKVTSTTKPWNICTELSRKRDVLEDSFLRSTKNERKELQYQSSRRIMRDEK
jgi:hypothetical protein